jgi:hypothetical protein
MRRRAGIGAYRDYTTALPEAWKNPPGVMRPQPASVALGPTGFVEAVTSADPAALAAAIERQGEAWRHGK